MLSKTRRQNQILELLLHLNSFLNLVLLLRLHVSRFLSHAAVGVISDHKRATEETNKRGKSRTLSENCGKQVLDGAEESGEEVGLNLAVGEESKII